MVQVLFLKIFAFIVVLLSIPIGIYLARLESDEVKSGRKYFVWLKNVTFLLILLTIMFSTLGIYYKIFFFLATILSFLFIHKKENNHIGFISIFAIVLLLMILLDNVTEVFLISVLAFIFGLAYISVMYSEEKSKSK